jgi:hypothetical protein
MERAGTGNRGRRWAIWAGVALIAWLVLTIDDWGRDFVASHAEIAEDSREGLEPLVSQRPSRQLEQAVRWAARRIGNWKLVGTAGDGPTRSLLFVRTNRLLRTKDDIVVNIEDRGPERVVTATSTSRLHVGDLGRNTRNLRRLLGELRDVLDGAARNPAPEPQPS